jgi:ceramide glucosyltransferase
MLLLRRQLDNSSTARLKLIPVWVNYGRMLVDLSAAALAGLSGALHLWQRVVGRRFPLHQRVADPFCTPPVTLLKPLKGCDSETESCLRSWFVQESSAPRQLLFGVANPDDPVCDVVRKLVKEYPETDATLVITGQQLGFNAKVSTLVQLQDLARHDTVVISDADVWAPPDLLANVVAPLRDPKVGLVNCFYQVAAASNMAMRLEAVAVNADFWSQVLQARSIKPIDFALGAVMATTRERLEEIGGWAVLLDHLADDYQLGRKIAAVGARIELCPLVVECRSRPLSWKEVWNHQLRWTRTVRVCQPLPFFFSILNNATIWPLLWVALEPSRTSVLAAAAIWLMRVVTARANERHLTSRPLPWRHAALPLFKDLVGAALWALAFAGDHIEWRGRRFRMRRDGTLIAASEPRAAAC